MSEKKTLRREEKNTAAEKEIICENMSFAAKEAFKRLRSNVIKALESDSLEGFCPVIGVTSVQPGEGKSMISVNLSYSMAELGKKVLLLDADMRRSSVHEKLGLKRTPGLSDLLRDNNNVKEAMRSYSGEGISFDVIPGGAIPKNPSELLNSRRMEHLLTQLRTMYDIIVIDLPPVGAVIDAVAVSKNVDGMLVVVRENNCPRNALNDCISQLKFSDVNILGFVVNGALEGAGKKYQYSYYY